MSTTTDYNETIWQHCQWPRNRTAGITIILMHMYANTYTVVTKHDIGMSNVIMYRIHSKIFCCWCANICLFAFLNFYLPGTSHAGMRHEYTWCQQYHCGHLLVQCIPVLQTMPILYHLQLTVVQVTMYAREANLVI